MIDLFREAVLIHKRSINDPVIQYMQTEFKQIETLSRQGQRINTRRVPSFFIFFINIQIDIQKAFCLNFLREQVKISGHYKLLVVIEYVYCLPILNAGKHHKMFINSNNMRVSRQGLIVKPKSNVCLGNDFRLQCKPP